MADDAVYLRVDFTGVNHFARIGLKKVRPMFQEMGEKHVDLLRKRYIAYSAGQGNWPPLADVTTEAKARKGLHPGILRATNKMLGSFSFVLMPNNKGYFAGIIKEGLQYPKKYCKLTVVQLALVHHQGEGRVPSRQVVAPPNARNFKKLTDIANKHFDKLKAEANSKNVVIE